MKQLEINALDNGKLDNSIFDKLNGIALCKIIYSVDNPIDLEYCKVNKAFQEHTGLFAIQGKRVSQTGQVFFKNKTDLINTCDKVSKSGKFENFESYSESLARWFSVSLFSPQRGYVIIFIEVINERKKYDNKLTKLDKRYQTLLEVSNDGIHVVDRNGNLIEVNDKFCNMLGYSREALLKCNLADIDAQFSNEELQNKLLVLIKNNEIIQTKHRRKDGSIFDVEINAIGVVLDGVDFVYASSRDITSRLQEESTRKDELDRLNKISSQLPGVVYQYVRKSDGSSHFPYASEGIRDIYKVSPEQVFEDASIVFRKIHEDDLEGVVQSINTSADKLTVWQHEYRVKDEDGSFRLLYGSAIPQKQNDGSVLWHGFITDITRQKRAESILVELSDRFKHIFDLHSSVMLLIVNDSGNILDANIAASEFYGYGRESLRSMNISEINILDRESLRIERELAVFEKRNYFLFIHKLSNGDLIPVEVHSTPVMINGKKTLFSIIHDISERVKNEELVKLFTNKLQKINCDLEAFAYIASHDLKAPLNAVNGLVGLLMHKNSNLIIEKQDEYLLQINNVVKQMNMLITDLLQFSVIGNNTDSFVEVDVNHLLFNIHEFFDELISQNNAEFIIHTLPIIKANKTLLNELFMNLIGNALKYHRSDKRLIIEIGYNENSDKHEFYVRDNGIGIAQENIVKLFVMFKRLNAASEYPGTGIGLSLCKKIVESHNGDIWVESVFGEGSTFYFTIEK